MVIDIDVQHPQFIGEKAYSPGKLRGGQNLIWWKAKLTDNT